MDPKPYITHTFDHKANMYSKSMGNTAARTGVPCHTMQIILSEHVQHNVFIKMIEFMYNKYKL
jgi:hypothetical protein